MRKQDFLSPINKLATDSKNFFRPTFMYSNARTALTAYLLSLKLEPEDEIWLPAYIGWSSREGSGVFDPILEVGARFRFYRVNANLEIDMEHLFGMCKTAHPRLLVLIHFFGFPDRNIEYIVEWAKEQQINILEDEAHAMYSDWVGCVCGRYGDASIFSLHKMLPFSSGGLLLLNNEIQEDSKNILAGLATQPISDNRITDYDLSFIAMIRRSNSKKLLTLLEPLHSQLEPLYPSLPDGVVPQTIPVRVYGYSRDKLYFELNSSGYGVVSLYHTLISPISLDHFPASHELAKCILNLPIHQDVTEEQLEAMVTHLKNLIC